MKKLYSNCFLFKKETDKAWPILRRIGLWIWNYTFVIISSIGIGLVSLVLAPGPYKMFRGYLEKPLLLALNILPAVLIMMLFYIVTRRAWIAFLLTSAICLGLSAANYFKLLFRDDPLMFADLTLVKEAGNMLGNYSLFISPRLFMSILCVILGTLFLFFFVRGKFDLKLRLITLTVFTASTIALTPTYLTGELYPSVSVDKSYYTNVWSATQNYIGRGFLYPFINSILSAFEAEPEGYDKDAASEILNSYSDEDIPENKKVNIVAVMLEAYNDFTKFGVPELSADVYETWHKLQSEGYSGKLITNIFAAGTVDTERTFLTGYSTLNNFRGNTYSYPWYLKEQGYTVEGMHPCYEWFYNRLNINEYLGFENYYFVENYFYEYTGGTVASDDIFFPELIKTYKNATENGNPYFNFSVTYQGHGPYPTDTLKWGKLGDFVVNNGEYTTEEHHILENYFGSIANTDKNLKMITDFFREDDEPVIFIVFGDHNPWMGDGNSVYNTMGVDFTDSTSEGFTNYYSTDYLIWANNKAKEVLGNDFTGDGPDIGPYFLMNKVFELSGLKGSAYMQAIEEVSQKVPVIHSTGQYFIDGQLTSKLSPDNEELVKKYKEVQYYVRNNFDKIYK